MRVKIIDIHEQDAYHYRKEEIIGLVGKFQPLDERDNNKEYMAGNFYRDSDSKTKKDFHLHFHRVKVEEIKEVVPMTPR